MVISENNKKIIYSLLVFPFPVTGIPILVYILPFYASNYNLGLSLVGLIFFAGRIIDVFTDPIMGALVDRYPSRFGKHKHWIFAFCSATFSRVDPYMGRTIHIFWYNDL